MPQVFLSQQLFLILEMRMNGPLVMAISATGVMSSQISLSHQNPIYPTFQRHRAQ
jgi:hypothetical protein